MGLGDLTPDESSNNSSSSSDSSESDGSNRGGGSSSSSTYPKFKEKVPYYAIWQDDDGVYHAGSSPHSHTIEYIKESKTKSWRQRMIPSDMVRYWMDPSELKTHVYIVDEVLGLDLMELLKDNPEAAYRAVVEAGKHYNVSTEPSTHRRCAVCDEELHTILDEFEEIHNRIICRDHTVAELTRSGLF